MGTEITYNKEAKCLDIIDGQWHDLQLTEVECILLDLEVLLPHQVYELWQNNYSDKRELRQC